MKHILFLVMGICLLLIAFFYEPLYALFPGFFEPIYQLIKDIGIDIFYITGTIALILGVFSWLPTWISLLLFIVLGVAGGYYLMDKNVSIKIGEQEIIVVP
ncbi:MAG: hypothetical protein DRR16_18150 [Candidatus Parabeggiatoa sp. nov. 3]|nr:MAG: hypothetical protein DRR00_07925 [Gammaproteobacteria bacterium]RKZ66092.1 MAG: hypothetical protein DRQ99_10680 [Gammaproteobacteria bacterium]RKZ83086.1 MAG: hypothetical protein DRR16_18150 [Gammaproteobacteria bacterium]